MDEKEWQAHISKVKQERKALKDAEDDYEDAEEWGDFDEDEGEDWGSCSCPYCYCGMPTEYGEVCNDCLAGCHQG